MPRLWFREGSSRATRSLALCAALAALAFLPSMSCVKKKGKSSTPPSNATPAQMSVTPSSGLTSVGFEGGPLAPDSSTFTVRNTGGKPLRWAARSNNGWVVLSATTGQLAPGKEISVRATLDQNALATLEAGVYPVIIDFLNRTNGTGSGSRSMELDIQGIFQSLSLEAGGGLRIEGPPGGPFTPTEKTYTLTNNGGDPIDWSASFSEPWLALAPAAGNLASGAQASFVATLDESIAAAFGVGDFSGNLSVANESEGTNVPGPAVDVAVRFPGVSALASSLTRHGTTWTFDAEYEVGQFANGDWWVVGPITIIGFTPESKKKSSTWIVNGAMVNPSPMLTAQGYDSTMFAEYSNPNSYLGSRNVAYKVTAADPVVIPVSSSLVSTVSAKLQSQRPQLRQASVLTVVPFPPAPGSFRPPYSGTDKTSYFNESQLNRSLLHNLAPVSSTPPLSEVENLFARVWIDHVTDWLGEYSHPTKNMPAYGREIAEAVGFASLMLHTNFTPEEKEPLLRSFVQLGIDLYGIVQAGGKNRWDANGGHHSGRKWPILFAGIVLADPDMSSIGFDPSIAFGEDDQTFYVQETSPGVYNSGFGGYGPQHVGMPEWGNQHQKNPVRDDSTWFGDSYRTCCTANAWWGELLAVRIMDVQMLWNHDALFDYQDRYRDFSLTTGQEQWTISWNYYPYEMWETYRNQF